MEWVLRVGERLEVQGEAAISSHGSLTLRERTTSELHRVLSLPIFGDGRAYDRAASEEGEKKFKAILSKKGSIADTELSYAVSWCITKWVCGVGTIVLTVLGLK